MSISSSGHLNRNDKDRVSVNDGVPDRRTGRWIKRTKWNKYCLNLWMESEGPNAQKTN